MATPMNVSSKPQGEIRAFRRVWRGFAEVVGWADVEGLVFGGMAGWAGDRAIERLELSLGVSS